MLVIFVSGLVLLALLVFAAGMLVGREWGLDEARSTLPAALPSAAKAVPAQPAVVPPVAAPPAPANPATGAIRLPEPAAPIPPIPALPPAKSSSNALDPRPRLVSVPDTGSSDRPETGRSPDREKSMLNARSVSAVAPDHAGGRTSESEGGRGYVVYVGAFENQSGAESLVDELRRRNLSAQTSTTEKPGRRSMTAVWVGMFDDRSAANAVLPAIREAGVADAYIRYVH